MMPEAVPHTAAVPHNHAAGFHKFWMRAFLIYGLLEVLLIAVSCWITHLKCPACVLPLPFYILNWLQQLAFTGLLWYCLNRCSRLGRIKTVLLNLALFVTWYFLSLGIRYGIFHSQQVWLIGPAPSIHNFRGYVYGSWIDIGKYVVILPAFYVLKFYYEYRRAEGQRIQLALINKDMQINLLKQQLSPHFYFNTLNNLYGLAHRNSRRLPGALQQLYTIMEYVIDDCNRPRVLLLQEIEFLNSYIALEKLRYEQDTVIEIRISGQAGRHTIVPLLLIQFVENAFKHGMKEKSADNWMEVHAEVAQGRLRFSVVNSCYGPAPAGGIGLESVKRLLQLQYENKHELCIQQGDNRFSVQLQLQLT